MEWKIGTGTAPVDGLKEAKGVCDIMDEKYMDPPEADGASLAHYHQDMHQMIGLCRGLMAAVSALSRPVVVSVGGKAGSQP